MRKVNCILIIILIPLFCISQNNPQKFRTASWQTFAYMVTAAEAEQFAKWDSIPVNKFIDRNPFMIFKADSVDEDKLPTGNYVLLTGKNIYIQAKFVCISDLALLEINNRNNLQLDVRNKAGEFITNASVFVNNNKAAYNTYSKTYWVKKNKLGNAFIKVYTPADTLFLTLEEKGYNTIPWQRKQNYRSAKIFKYLYWLPLKIKQLFGDKYYYKDNRVGARGFIIFNQPKYKPLDTVKFKGYVVNKRGRQYHKNIYVRLNYYKAEKNHEQLISILRPTSRGAFVGQFVLADTIPSDIRATLVFATAGEKDIIENQFNIEDYVLDEISSYSFEAEKLSYYKNDSLRFFASAKDANGLNVMDAKASLILTTDLIKEYYQDTLFVKDTLYNKEVPLLTEGDTRFAIATNNFPKADITISATLTFKNSNNEQHTESETITYKHQSREIQVTQNEDSIKAIYIEDGIEKIVTGSMSINNDKEKPVVFPVYLKIDPLATDYSFYISDKNGKTTLSEFFDVKTDYRLDFSRISRKDTLGFILNNPYKIPVYYTVFSGNNIIATDKQSGELVAWQKKVNDPRRLYKVRWQYIWAGSERSGEESIMLLYKLLNIKINSSATVFPGQEDSIHIDIKDYKGEAASNVNLTAVSYNNQFKKYLHIQEPPYLAKYKSKKYLKRQWYKSENENENFSLIKNYLLAKNRVWVNKLHLDTMAYYKLLFPKNSYAEVTLINNFIPQLSVNVVKGGVPQEIYLLYINRQLVYYNGSTDSMKYAFEVFPENVQIGIRLKDKFIEIDSLYIQSHYKHDLSFDLDSLPQHVKVYNAEKFWSNNEMTLLEESMLQMQNDYQNNDAYIWQQNTLVRLKSNRQHIAGPFRKSNITFFKPGSFDINFNFEPRYLTSFSKQIIRLEKNLLFPRRDKKNMLPEIKKTELVLGDTIVPPPPIAYPAPEEHIILQVSRQEEYNFYESNKSGKGSLQFTKPKDSVFAYYILEPSDSAKRIIVIPGSYNLKIKNITPGLYILSLVTNKNLVAQVNNILIQANGTTCVKVNEVNFTSYNALLRKIVQRNDEYKNPVPVIIKKVPEKYTPEINRISVGTGNSSISGNVIDDRGGNSVPFASVRLAAYNRVIATDESGYFSISGISPGNYALTVSAVGYAVKRVTVKVGTNENIKVDIIIRATSQSSTEVVVTALGISRSRNLTGSFTTIKGTNLELETQLQGRVAGVAITNNGNPGLSSQISLRGISTLQQSNTPLYVIDGILYDELPANLNEGSIRELTVLKDTAAVALYGARAANGVVLITTQTKTLRQQFHDYALWQPNFFTDKNGHASIPINYPDNITGWKTYVLAMDKKRRIGKASMLTQAYKPMVAELSLPQFLIDGDSANIIGKSKNYTADKYFVKNEFRVDGNMVSSREKQLLPNDANIESLKITNKYLDTLKASFTLQSTTGFTDGEERKIPVFKKGTEEAVGNFWVLQNDTTFSFIAMPGMDKLNVYAQNSTLDLMLEELEHLRSYPYYCMEQIASKLTGLALEKKIREQLRQPFTNQKEFDRLLQRIQKAQLFDGGWGWWESGKANFYITNYITNALLKFRENTLVETNIRNAFLYLQNQLPSLKTKDLLAALFTLSSGKHAMNYTEWINRINYDSLTQHQQWQLIAVKQQQKMNYDAELKKLFDKKVTTILGGTHWGIENYSWHSNEIATTVLAYMVLEKEAAYNDQLISIIQYFLERRRNGYWRNTVESATILNTILPKILSEQKDFIKPAILSVRGDTSFSINKFPYSLQSNSGKIKNISISKSGGGLVYLTAYQQIFNPLPQPVEENFIIKTNFQKNSETITTIKAGERIKMIVNVNALKDADYVQMEIPIPAGCTYASKNNSDWKVHKEFYKNKVSLFTESLSKGIHQFEIELEARYSGIYTLNPAKTSLMYYPVFYGRNDMKKINIDE